ncbi:MAG: lytic transglycosylase F [Bacteroidetes bacterium HGW-Bacteroidetes-1]|jgi:membrane-bound lytic murein transglycosylase F|nr:MAG: lytic transglycosylase F [Bacteroidetes bacterium HGW-Bacteroidetes-1]
MKIKKAPSESLIIALLIGLLLVSCQTRRQKTENIEEPPEIPSVLNQVLNSRKLKVITDYNTVNYYIYRGEPMGYQYELLKAFTDHLGVRLELRIENNLSKAKEELSVGKSDLIALGMTVTGERMKRFDFSEPILITRQVLVQRLPKNWNRMNTRDEIEKDLIRTSLELARKEIHVQSGSIYKKRLEILADEIGDSIYIVEDKRDVEELIAAVSKGDIDFTVADEHIASVVLRNFPNLDIKTAVSFDQKIAWALQKEENKDLLNEINLWLKSYLSTNEARLLYSKYFSDQVRNRSRSEYHSFTGGKLSPYDDMIKKTANEINWDWRLLASLIYQESEFKHNSYSWMGAFGLMQLMPAVMEQFGIDTTSYPEEHIRVGGHYLRYLDKQIPETVKLPQERIKFVLAAYNAGIAHVLDARRLAVKYNKDQNVWTENVDFFLRNKSKPTFYNDPVSYYGYVRGEETYLFVEQILDRYEHYKNLIPD